MIPRFRSSNGFLPSNMICSAKKGIPSLQLKRELDLGSYESALYMTHRIRLAMREDPGFCQKFSGIVEVDETYVGGKAKGPRGRGAANKVPVVAMNHLYIMPARLARYIKDAEKKPSVVLPT